MRIAVSEAAAWTGRRFYGGELPRSSPTASSVPAELPVLPAPAPDAPLRIVFVGQAVERKGLPVLLRAFEALREHVPATLTLVGASHDEVAPLMLDDRGVTRPGQGLRRARSSPRWRAADVLVRALPAAARASAWC